MSGVRCKLCSEINKATNKLTYEDVKSFIESKGYKLISKEYKTSTSLLLCECKEHGEFNMSYKSFYLGCGCQTCGRIRAKEKISSDNNYNWRGGITEIKNYLRAQLSPWTQLQLQRTNYTCELTGKQGNLNVHHMYSFKNILQDTMKELNMDIRPSIGDYSNKELKTITAKFINNNNLYAKPVVMLESIHNQFHIFCGNNREDTSMGQLKQFKESLVS